MTVRIQYAVPARQAWLAIGGVMLITAGIALLALGLRSPLPLTGSIIAWTGLAGWGIVRNLNAQGEATLDAAGLVIVPRRRALCAPRGPVQLAWDDLVSVRTGATYASTPRQFTMLRTRTPVRSWILMTRDQADTGFHQELLDRAHAARPAGSSGPLDVRDVYDSRGWRIAAVTSLILFAAGVAGVLLSGESDNFSLWARVVTIGCFAIPLASVVFRPRRR